MAGYGNAIANHQVAHKEPKFIRLHYILSDDYFLGDPSCWQVRQFQLAPSRELLQGLLLIAFPRGSQDWNINRGSSLILPEKNSSFSLVSTKRQNRGKSA